ncbi:MAG: nitroreductase family protein [Clostridia bacterium]|nr:nitroreductase family protein [Clostridia bacterium]
MSVYDIILKRRSIRKFEDRTVEKEKLEKMVNAARLAPSGANLQPLKYIAVTTPELCEKVFGVTKYAGYLKDWNPTEADQPRAYIVVLQDMAISKNQLDAGAAVENIILTALEDGIASCWVGSFNGKELRGLLAIEEGLEINSVVALGYPAQNSEEAPFDGDVKYYMDDNGDFHVPKRAMDEIFKFM